MITGPARNLISRLPATARNLTKSFTTTPYHDLLRSGLQTKNRETPTAHENGEFKPTGTGTKSDFLSRHVPRKPDCSIKNAEIYKIDHSPNT